MSSKTPSEDRASFEAEGGDMTEVELEEEITFGTETGDQPAATIRTQ